MRHFADNKKNSEYVNLLLKINKNSSKGYNSLFGPRGELGFNPISHTVLAIDTKLGTNEEFTDADYKLMIKYLLANETNELIGKLVNIVMDIGIGNKNIAFIKSGGFVDLLKYCLEMNRKENDNILFDNVATFIGKFKAEQPLIDNVMDVCFSNYYAIEEVRFLKCLLKSIGRDCNTRLMPLIFLESVKEHVIFYKDRVGLLDVISKNTHVLLSKLNKQDSIELFKDMLIGLADKEGNLKLPNHCKNDVYKSILNFVIGINKISKEDSVFFKDFIINFFAKKDSEIAYDLFEVATHQHQIGEMRERDLLKMISNLDTVEFGIKQKANIIFAIRKIAGVSQYTSMKTSEIVDDVLFKMNNKEHLSSIKNLSETVLSFYKNNVLGTMHPNYMNDCILSVSMNMNVCFWDKEDLMKHIDVVKYIYKDKNISDHNILGFTKKLIFRWLELECNKKTKNIDGLVVEDVAKQMNHKMSIRDADLIKNLQYSCAEVIELQTKKHKIMTRIFLKPNI